MSDFNIGLIGSGRIGQVHAGSIADTKGANLAWICDPFIEGAEKLAAEFGGGRDRLIDAEARDTARRGHAILAQDFFRLVFVYFHAQPFRNALPASEGRRA